MSERFTGRVLLAALLGMVLPACQVDSASPSPFMMPQAGLGVHLLLDDGRGSWPVEVWPEHLRYARQSVGEWGYVVELVRLDDLDPGRWQILMDQCADLHLTPVLRLATVYDREHGWWAAPEADPDGSYRTVAGQYAAFVSALRWPSADHRVVVGNEPNHGNEWGGGADPESYARFLIDVADALHAADPGAYILNAGFDPCTPHTNGIPWVDGMTYIDEESFLDRMVAAYPDVFEHLDGWASHSYPMGPFSAPPWEQSYGVDLLNGAVNPSHREPPPGVYNRGINGYEWELFKLESYGLPELPVYITETGWRHSQTVDPSSLDGGDMFPGAETVADYMYLALRGNDGRYPDFPEEGWTPWRKDPRVAGVMFFALDGVPEEWGHTSWLLLDEDGSVLGIYPLVDRLSEISTDPE